MANLRDIKRRIKSVKNTQQITKAMKMVAAAKLRRSQDTILATRPYALELAKVTGKLAEAAQAGEAAEGGEAPGEDRAGAAGEDPAAGPAAEGAGERPAEGAVEVGEEWEEEGLEDGEPDGGGATHPLLQVRSERKVLLAVVTGDRGLAGSFNANVIRRAREVLDRWERVELLLLGKKGADFFARRDLPIREAYRDLFSDVSYERASAIAEDVSAAYAGGEYDAVWVVYNQFKSVMQQELTEERLLPVPVRDEGQDHRPEDVAVALPSEASADYIYEPSPEGILSEILPRYVNFQVYRVLLESQAAEHAARMTAMDSATKNAGEMIDKLTLQYNRARQAAITTELIEVVSGANALEG